MRKIYPEKDEQYYTRMAEYLERSRWDNFPASNDVSEFVPLSFEQDCFCLKLDMEEDVSCFMRHGEYNV